MTKPTYQATEIKRMVLSMQVDHEGFKILADLIEDELHLYNDEELAILCEASMIMFTRSMFKISLKNVESHRRKGQ